MMSEIESIESKRKSILEQLEVLAKQEFGDAPTKDNSIGVVCLYGSGSVLDWQPDGVILKYDDKGGLYYMDYVMGPDGQLRFSSSDSISRVKPYIDPLTRKKSMPTPKNIILKAIATKRISPSEMEYVNGYVAEGKRFTDWNEEVLLEKVSEIYQGSRPMADEKALALASKLFE